MKFFEVVKIQVSKIKMVTVGIAYIASLFVLVLTLITSPFVFYTSYIVLWGGASEGEAIYYDLLTSSKYGTMQLCMYWFVLLIVSLVTKDLCKKYLNRRSQTLRIRVTP
jgi:hypothetical protein